MMNDIVVGFSQSALRLKPMTIYLFVPRLKPWVSEMLQTRKEVFEASVNPNDIVICTFSINPAPLGLG